jgi:YVTN family beta-propeller protein
MTVSPDGARLLVTNHADDSVSSIDTGNGAVARTILGTSEPFAVAVAATRPQRAYVNTASAAYDAIVAIDAETTSVVATHPVAHSVRDLAASRDGRHVYAGRTASGGADVAVLDTGTGRVDAIDIASTAGTTTESVCVSPDGRRCYVATDGPSGAHLVVVDTCDHSVVRTVEIGAPIRDVALHPDGGTAYVASCGPDFETVLDVVDTRTNMVSSTCKIPEISGFFTQLTMSGDGQRAYFIDDGGVTAVCTRTHDVIGAIAVSHQPSSVVESPDGKYIYVADHAGTVSMVAIASVVVDYAPTAPHQWALSEPRQLDPVMT